MIINITIAIMIITIIITILLGEFWTKTSCKWLTSQIRSEVSNQNQEKQVDKSRDG